MKTVDSLIEKVVFKQSVEQLQLLSLLESGLVPPTVANPDFVRRICTQASAQGDWVPILLRKILGEEPIPTPVRNKYEFTTIFSLFKKANTSNISKPMINIPFLNKTLKMSVASPNARYPGAISLVYDESEFGYVGSIGLDHSVVFIKKGREIKEQLIDTLMAFEAAPVTLLHDYANKHNRCPLCLRTLMKADLSIGYDGDCAKRFGLHHAAIIVDDIIANVLGHIDPNIQLSLNTSNPFEPARMMNMLKEYENKFHGY